MIKLDKKVWIYISVLIVISYLFQFFVIVKGGEEYELFSVIMGFMMFFPAIGALFYLLKSKEGLKYINWKIGKPVYLLFGLTIPAVITLFSVGIIEEIGWGVNKYFTIQSGEVAISDNIFLLGNEQQNIFFFLLNFMLTGIAYSLLSGIITIGEEIGWRGFLQKKLLEKNSVFRSLFFLGLIWGIWHFPIILNGFNYPEYPVLGAFLLFPLTTIFISFLLGWLTINSKSIWPAVFIHGGINSIVSVLHSMDFGENKLKANFLILGIWMIVGVISYLLIKDKLKTANKMAN